MKIQKQTQQISLDTELLYWAIILYVYQITL